MSELARRGPTSVSPVSLEDGDAIAEYVGKRLAVEAFVAYGSALDGADCAPLAFPADMLLPTCSTRPLHGPVLAAAALAAPRFDAVLGQPGRACELLR